MQILGLDNCQMPQEVSASLLLVLSTCKYLEFLSPPGNTLTGCLSNYIPQPILRELDISNAGLNKGDLLYLINLVENNKVPQLQKLWLVRNDLQEMTHLLERLVEAFVIHHQRELVLLLFKINLLDDSKRKLISYIPIDNTRTHVQGIRFAGILCTPVVVFESLPNEN